LCLPFCRARSFFIVTQVFWSIRASSVLPLVNTVSSIFSGLVLPLIGAVVDETPHRRRVGLAASYGLLLTNAAQASVGKGTWEFVSALSFLSAVLFFTVQSLQLAYLPELSTEPRKVSMYTGRSRAIELSATLSLIIFTVVVSTGITQAAEGGESLSPLRDAVLKARVAQATAMLLGGPSLLMAWHCGLGDRPPLRSRGGGARPQGGCLQLWARAVLELRTTYGELRREFVDLACFLVAFAFWEAAGSSFVILTTTFLVFELGFGSQDIAAFFLLTILVSIAASVACARFGPTQPRAVKAFVLAALTYCIVVLFTFVLGCQSKAQAFGFSPFLAVANATSNYSQRFAYSLILPGGREAELFGVYSFAAQIIAWAPPLVFVLVNQLVPGASLRVALVVPLGLFYSAGLLLTWRGVDLERAVGVARLSLGLRTGPAFRTAFRATRSAALGGASGGASGGVSEEGPGSEEAGIVEVPRWGDSSDGVEKPRVVASPLSEPGDELDGELGCGPSSQPAPPGV